MIIDVTGVLLIPGNFGNHCPGNGEHPEFEYCCDECDYMACCFEMTNALQCLTCPDRDCPWAGKGCEGNK